MSMVEYNDRCDSPNLDDILNDLGDVEQPVFSDDSFLETELGLFRDAVLGHSEALVGEYGAQIGAGTGAHTVNSSSSDFDRFLQG